MSVSQLRNGESGGVMFSSSFGNKEFKLIEVPEDVFELVMGGESLKIILASREEFFEEWSLTTPGVTCSGPGMAEHEHLLRGLALREPIAGNNSFAYKYFSIADLSLDPKTRFSQLFAVKPRFRLDELEPYLVGLFGPGGVLPKSQAELLLQHTKCVDDLYILKGL
eukprot:gene21397-27427_t